MISTASCHSLGVTYRAKILGRPAFKAMKGTYVLISYRGIILSSCMICGSFLLALQSPAMRYLYVLAQKSRCCPSTTRWPVLRARRPRDPSPRRDLHGTQQAGVSVFQRMKYRLAYRIDSRRHSLWPFPLSPRPRPALSKA